MTRPTIEALADAFAVKDGAVWYAGAPLPDAAGPIMPDEGGISGTVRKFANQIYTHAYTRRRSSTPVMNDKSLERDFIANLANANQSVGRMSHGWQQVGEMPGGEPILTKDGVRMIVLPETVEGPPENRSVRLENGSERAQPGWFYAFGDTAEDEATRQTRIYWNITRDGATKLMKAVTSNLNQARIPFMFKTLSNPQAYVRADAAVLYLDAKHLQTATTALTQVHHAVAPWLVHESPLFTQELGPGVGWAETPSQTGESFGVHRSLALASALHEAASADANAPDTIRAAFQEAGIDPEAPCQNLRAPEVLA